jgi:hypothetical protein
VEYRVFSYCTNIKKKLGLAAKCLEIGRSLSFSVTVEFCFGNFKAIKCFVFARPAEKYYFERFKIVFRNKINSLLVFSITKIDVCPNVKKFIISNMLFW